ncbi:hypothetical protein LL912_05715 [Niabella sp. CC-SYL272]|uniref:hypothetical protein n=1 Tax=Niabella agricola TaxID=2891571 RepID=UPI001F28BD12|nr:hypothetical protein [Niabella agricola]MCF3108269.1 hypothetical protein [Niabella agricola]
MRPAMKENKVGFFDKDSRHYLPVTFTGDAIQHLSSLTNAFNIKEWVWHTEEIDGKKYCIVTDRRQPAGSPDRLPA